MSKAETAPSTAANRELPTSIPPWLHALVKTESDIGPSVARWTLGLVMFPHGAQKLLGWFDGYGFTATMDSFTQSMGLPWVVAFLVIVAESFGALGLVVGLAGRLGALGIGSVMVGAILTGHLQHGFFMNWFGNQTGEGIEYHLLAIGLAIVVLVKGSGAYSVDRRLSRRGGR